MISLLWPFSYSCILCLFLHHFYGLFYHLSFRDISLKSQESFVLFSVTFHLIFNGFICLTFFRELSLLSYPIRIRYLFVSFYSFIYSDIVSHLFIRILIGLVLCLTFSELFSYSLFIRLFIHHSFVLSFELFSISIYLFCVFVLVKLC